MSEMYHEIKIEFKTEESCNYVAEILNNLSVCKMPKFQGGDLISKLIYEPKLEYFKTYLGYEWCFEPDESPAIDELKVNGKELSVNIYGPMSHPHERLVEMLRSLSYLLGIFKYYEIIENSRVGAYKYIWLSNKRINEIDGSKIEGLYEIQIFKGNVENKFEPILKEIDNQKLEVSEYSKINFLDLSYEDDGKKTYKDYLEDLRMYEIEKPIKEKLRQEKIAKMKLKYEKEVNMKNTKPRISKIETQKGIGALFSKKNTEK